MRLSDYKINTKLIIAFTIVALIGASLGAYAILNMKRINDADTRLYAQELVGLSLMKEANFERQRMIVAIRDALIATDAALRDDAFTRIGKAREQSQTLMNQAAPLFSTDEGRAGMAKLKEEWSGYLASVTEIEKLIKVSDMATSNPALVYLKGTLLPTSNQTGAAMTALSKLKEVEAKEVSDGNDALYQQRSGAR
ncbi:MCP four helix bundle domain-containing protein [Roseateles sp.]|uniref:MCP four helix bundle domain-containing protein n=1 Tax=Roseateles sp. TaxID=1971397 RepID=UPI00286A21B2|nr:MCP four helix bundle domain-containing protein [Roseateles sp.]